MPASAQTSHSLRGGGALFVLAQAVEKVRATPGFAAAAERAKQAYQTQTVMAAQAVQNFAATQGLDPGYRLTWRARPDVSQVGQHPPSVRPDFHGHPVNQAGAR